MTGADQHVRECVYNSYVSVCTRVRWHERRSRCLFSGAPGSRAPPAPGQSLGLPLGVRGPLLRTLAQNSSAMGSAPDGTMCVYCYQEEADYIPDGLLGFTCGTCMDECPDFGIEFLDRKRMTRFLRSLRAVTGGQRGEGRRNPFYHLFLEEDAQLGYGIAPFLIRTTPTPRAAVAAPELPASSWSSVTEGSDDDGNDRWSLLWEHQWQVVMEAELGSPAEVPTWTLDRVLPEWHTIAYRGLRTAHGRTELVQATHEIMRARYETLQAEQSLREAERTVLIAQHNLRAAQRNHVLAVAQERQYDTGVRYSTADGWDENGQRRQQPQWRLPERYESAWAILAWMTTHGPVGN